MIVEKLVGYIVLGISAGGYFGLFVLMALESMIVPVPSEIVMPFAGYLVLQGRFNFWTAVLVSGLGSIFGSLLSYYIGVYGGRPFVLKFGKTCRPVSARVRNLIGNPCRTFGSHLLTRYSTHPSRCLDSILPFLLSAISEVDFIHLRGITKRIYEAIQ